jgi:hypothetical protein
MTVNRASDAAASFEVWPRVADTPGNKTNAANASTVRMWSEVFRTFKRLFIAVSF